MTGNVAPFSSRQYTCTITFTVNQMKVDKKLPVLEDNIKEEGVVTGVREEAVTELDEEGEGRAEVKGMVEPMGGGDIAVPKPLTINGEILLQISM